jgi:hypothetical protein
VVSCPALQRWNHLGSATRRLRQPNFNHSRDGTQFQFDSTEFSKQVAYRSVELDSGGTLTAESSEFDKVFRQELVDAKEHKIRFSTEGKVISEKLGKSR